MALHKRDREARRPDKAWRTSSLLQLLRAKYVDEFDIVGTFWYNKTIDTQTMENNNDTDTQSRP